MCGIFGVLPSHFVSQRELKLLARHSEQRGKDSSGLFVFENQRYTIYRENQALTCLVDKVSCNRSVLVMGHSRLITNGLIDNQPVYRDGVCVIHNGIIVNHEDLWSKLKKTREQEIDTEIIAAIVSEHIEAGGDMRDVPKLVVDLCKGIVACAVAVPKMGKLCLFSNNGSLYYGEKNADKYFASECFPLQQLGCSLIRQIKGEGIFLDIPLSIERPVSRESSKRTINLIPSLGKHHSEERMLEYSQNTTRRCTKCILPETMPYIHFDKDGVCNYCRNYKPRNRPRPNTEIFNLILPYRRAEGNDCIVPFSGGRDSCYALHLIKNELGMRPITYTYDWGMVTDLGRRNISRMCAELGVENIIIADNIAKKRRNIAKNLSAWLKAPNLGMVSILTAGDKHFFRYVETVKKQTGISLNLWGVNPLEVTHFKSGFLGVPPDFEEKTVYSNGAIKQLRYQWLRFKAMTCSPGYFNSSLWDTLSGEYYRSFTKKNDYYHVFDYWRWDEKKIDSTLVNCYGWETAPDTKTTWRIGDGTAAIYNYIYYTVAGFTEHDTFRSNQIREGDLSRSEALELVHDENRPRYPNIKWYLDAVGMDFVQVIKVINSIPKAICNQPSQS
jgi:glucosamine--fructose-6-phosphate aminotransferase (isomerizing)